MELLKSITEKINKNIEPQSSLWTQVKMLAYSHSHYSGSNPSIIYGPGMAPEHCWVAQSHPLTITTKTWKRDIRNMENTISWGWEDSQWAGMHTLHVGAPGSIPGTSWAPPELIPLAQCGRVLPQKICIYRCLYTYAYGYMYIYIFVKSSSKHHYRN